MKPKEKPNKRYCEGRCYRCSGYDLATNNAYCATGQIMGHKCVERTVQYFKNTAFIIFKETLQVALLYFLNAFEPSKRSH